MHLPLSQHLLHILDAEAHGKLTLNSLIERTHGRGIYLVIILLNLPFITPIPLPGFSTVLGLVILFLAVRLAWELPPRLPRFMGERDLSRERMGKIVRGSIKVLKFVEKWVRPRRTDWLTWRSARFMNAMLLALLACLLALPLPPVIPLSNTLPGCGIIFLAASMMEEDGVMIWFGYVLAFATIAYFVLAGNLITLALLKLAENFI